MTESCALVEQALLSEFPREQLEELYRSGVLRELYPEVTVMVGFGGDDQGHKDLWEHTKQVGLPSGARAGDPLVSALSRRG